MKFGSGSPSSLNDRMLSSVASVTWGVLLEYVASIVIALVVAAVLRASVCTTQGSGVSCDCQAGAIGLRCEGSVTELARYEFSALSGITNNVFPLGVSTSVLLASPLSRGTLIEPALATGQFASSGWTIGATAPVEGEWVGFSLAPSPGRLLTLTSITFPDSRTGTGPQSAVIRSSLTGQTNLVGPYFVSNSATTMRTIVFDPPLVTSQAVTLQILPYGATHSLGTYRLGDFIQTSSTNRLVVKGGVTDATP